MIYRAIAKLPFSALYLLSSTLAFLLHRVFRYRYSISLDNLKRAFPTKTAQEIKAIHKSAYLHLTDSFLEVLKASNISDKEINARVEIKNFAEVDQYLNNKQPVFLLSAHTAPTEWIAFAISLKFNCFVDPVYKPIHSKSLDQFIFATRSKRYGTPIPYKKLAKDVLLRKNVKRSIAMLADLEPRSRDQALEINFLNRPTRFFLGSERIIKLAELPVFFIGIKQLSRGYYQAYAEKITDNPKNLAPEEITRRYAKSVEKVILDNPPAWLWTHKRWKHSTT